MLKILFVNDFLEGGGAEKVFRDTHQFMKKFFETDLFFASEHIEKPENFKEYIYSSKFKKLISMKLNSFKPDIVHLHNYYHKLSPSILEAIGAYKEKNRKIKVIMTVHDYHLLAPNSGLVYFGYLSNSWNRQKKVPLGPHEILLKKWDYRGFNYSLLKKLQWIFAYKLKNYHKIIDVLIAPSRFLANLLEKTFTGKKVVVIRNPVEIPKSHTVTKKDQHKLKIIFAGRVAPEKGLKRFIEKLSEIRDIDFLFTIVGDGPELPILKKLTLKLKMPNVVFKGKLSHEKTLLEMQKHNIFVLPSLWYEIAPLSIVEASMCKLKILTMNYGGMKELAQLCGNYYLLNENLRNLREALLKLKDMEFSDNSEKLKRIFSKENYIAQLKKLYISS